MGVSEVDQLSTLSPLLGLAMAKGDLPAALSVAEKFIKMKDAEQFQETAYQVKPMLKNL
jgi:hypothetical protein